MAEPTGLPSSGWRVALICYGTVLLLVASSLAARSTAIRLSLQPGSTILLSGLLPALLTISAIILAEWFWDKGSIVECLKRLGLGPIHFPQAKAALFCTIAIIAAYCVMFLVLKIPTSTVPYLPVWILKWVIGQGIGEEIVFRGFAFRRLREGRSFWGAALVSSALFSSVHLAHLAHGISAEVLANMTMSIGLSFLMGLSLARLFEWGAGSLWGCAWLHFSCDSWNLLAQGPDAGLNAGYVVYISGVLTALALVFTIGRRPAVETK